MKEFLKQHGSTLLLGVFFGFGFAMGSLAFSIVLQAIIYGVFKVLGLF